jgi:uncharacterized protein YbbC (DUF1343 family)
VRIIVADRDAIDAGELGIELASALHTLYAKDYKLDSMIDLLADQKILEAIAAGQDPRRIQPEYRAATARFEKLRKEYLIY